MTALHPRGPQRRRRGALLVAVGLSVLLTVDPFGLDVVATGQAAASETTESREANFAAALAGVQGEGPAPATDLEGDWPATESEGLRLPSATLPVPDEQTVTIPVGEAATVDVGGMTVEVSGVDGSASPESVTLRTAEPDTAAAAGLTGVVLDVVDATQGERGGALEVELAVSYAEFAGLVGGDWSSRLGLVHLPDCASQTPAEPACQPQTIPTVNDPVAQTLTGTVPLDAAPAPEVQSLTMSASLSSPSGGSVAITAGVSGSAGDWSQTSLSASSTWGTSGNSGAFTWSYPVQVPAPPAGPAPELTLSYSSAVSDGRVPSANTQSGWIGEGFDLTSSYIERQYKPCTHDQTGQANNIGRDSGDLCWGPDNATLVFKGTASPLVRDAAAGVWRSKSDDGTRVELLTGASHGGHQGEHWKVTTVDGTQYFFGDDATSAWTVPVYGNHSGDPCFKGGADGGFAASRCTQAWRWNLHKVVDPSDNTMTYTYATETNHYVPDYANNPQWDVIPYVSGGRLSKIEYGTRTGQAGNAPFQVVFDAAKRCVTDRADGRALCAIEQSESDKSKWLDTPTDLQCTASADNCASVVPVFFDTTRLAKITAQAFDGTGYRDIDSWAFAQRYVGESDAHPVEVADSVTLRLDSVRRTGHGGTAGTGDDLALPSVEFGYDSMRNRVDSVTDGQSALWRPRVIRVRTDSGGAVNIAYRTECDAAALPADPAANTLLCYPVRWQPRGELQPATHWFHKYVVESITEDGSPHGAGDDLVTESLSKVTRYLYGGGAAWAKPTGPLVDASEATYSEFRGFREVTTEFGEGEQRAPVQRVTYFRGMGGSLAAGPTGQVVTVTDREPFTGMPFSTITLNGATKVSQTITEPGTPVDVASAGGLTSTRIPSTTTHGFTYDAGGEPMHRTYAKTTNNKHGLPVEIDDRGGAGTSDDVCTKIAYKDDFPVAKNMVSYASRTETIAASCGAELTDAKFISRETAIYDAAGRPTETTSVDPNNAAADIRQSRTTYDERGRALTVEDAAGNVTTTVYTPSAGGQVSKVATTSPDSRFTTVQTFDPLTGRPVKTTDQNGKETVGTYDTLGRLVSVRYPQHKSSPKPSIEYEYTVKPNGLNAVTTRTLGADGQRQHTSVVLYDGMLRPFQSQVEGGDAHAADRGRMVSHVFYDSLGRMVKKTGQWWAAGAANATPLQPIAVAPSHTTYVYDGAGRVTDEVLWNGTDSNPDHEKWRTKTVYDGAVTLVIPPRGGVPTESVTDARGQLVEMREYLRDPDTQAMVVTAAAIRALPHQSTAYSYTPAGQLQRMENATGDEWTYTYDLAGRQVSSTDPDGGTTTTTYDVLGQVVSRENGNGEVLAYTYDVLGRVTSLRDGSTSGPIRAEWEYDTSVDLSSFDVVLGPLATAKRKVGGLEYLITYSYDDAYRPTTIETVLPTDASLRELTGASFTTEYAYAADGQISQITYPQVSNGSTVVLGKEKVTTRFDAASRPEWLSGGFGWGTYVADARWTAEGRPLLQDLGNTYGAVVSYDWDEGTNRLSSVRLDRERVSGTEVDLAYGYDAAGNVTSMIDAPLNTLVAGVRDAQCFQYDGLRRLQTAWTAGDADCDRAQVASGDVGGVAPYWNEYEYDPLGNRTVLRERAGAQPSTTTYEHGAGGAGPHQLTSLAETTGGVSVTTGFGWDAAGNQVSRTVDGQPQSLVWDAEGELVSVTGGGAGSVSNVFDADGSRLVRVDASAVTVFLPGGMEVRSTASAVSVSRWYTFGGAVVAVRTGVGMAGVSSVVSDAHGTPVATVHNTDWPAAVVRVRTDPFGAARAGQVGTVAEHGFLGAAADPGGLSLLGARFYDPGTGTFLSVDPVLDPMVSAQFNAYVYAGNNPVTWSDPSGLGWRSRMQTDTRYSSTPVHKCDMRQMGCQLQAAVANKQTAAAWKQTAQKRKDANASVHGVLTGLGLIPGLGEFLDGLDGLISLAEGDFVGAGLSAAAMIPVFGWIPAGTKLGRVGTKLAHPAGSGPTAKVADEAPIAWPPNNGFDGAHRVTVLKPGTQVDRFGHDGGHFVAPNGTPVGQRSLAPGTTAKPYKVFEVTNRLVVQKGPAAPWFGQPGGGIQYRLPSSVEDLLNAGYLRRIG